jgi:hypothetical protein
VQFQSIIFSHSVDHFRHLWLVPDLTRSLSHLQLEKNIMIHSFCGIMGQSSPTRKHFPDMQLAPGPRDHKTFHSISSMMFHRCHPSATPYCIVWARPWQMIFAVSCSMTNFHRRWGLLLYSHHNHISANSCITVTCCSIACENPGPNATEPGRAGGVG